MKTDEQITRLIQQHKFDSARYGCIDRLKRSRLDAQAWVFLSQTMVGLKRGDMAKLCLQRAALLAPFADFRQAWNDTERVGRGSPDKQVQTLLDTEHVPVSACVLTLDSSRTIRQCIAALVPAVDEIVVVDTGSQDDTVQILESLGLDVHYFEWIDDFSAARTYAESLAAHDWIITVDSDEILVLFDVNTIRVAAALFNGTGMALNAIQLNRIGERVVNVHPTARMYQKSTGIRWRYPIHEQLETRQGHEVSRLQTQDVNIQLLHDGYDNTATSQIAKVERNIRIIRSVLASEPTHPVFLFYLARELQKLGHSDEAQSSIESAIKHEDGTTGMRGEMEKLQASIRAHS
ncbi:glycosyltransferase family 2 protein [Alicyclobacillus ferrooxydans]|uniref:Glycosyltransferase 2-like domain-containing protein n=1 Tax=Alicyclobacillus ferrooxydans TaxID=471514 RepID=A0A0P9CZ63_9BACL|nr:glycosyltransferase family 2 protein [Alicyclobacillus ferrooxydans]KPV42306.1 hypothetical protein AN477_18575 [Alicyclobacillus ferrooxydans]